MKLYYSPGACSLAPHIVARESGWLLDLGRVDLASHRLADGADYHHVNPRGQVPALELDDGSLLTEGTVIAQFLADRAQAREIMPAAGTLARYRVMQWQSFVGAELHKSYGPLFKPALPDDARALFLANLHEKYAWLDRHLSDQAYLTGEAFTAADAYLFTVTNWSRSVGLDLAGLARIQAFQQRVAARPAVVEAMRAEGLRD